MILASEKLKLLMDIDKKIDSILDKGNYGESELQRIGEWPAWAGKGWWSSSAWKTGICVSKVVQTSSSDLKKDNLHYWNLNFLENVTNVLKINHL